MPNTFYPSISRLITKETASGNLGMFHDALDQVFDHTFYRDLQTDKSKHGDYAFFWLKVILYRKLGFEIPGTNGLELLLNPSDTVTNGTEIPITLGYKWDILKTIKNFSMPTFKGDEKAFFDNLMAMVKPSLEELFGELIANLFYGADPLQEFVDSYNDKYPNNPINPITPLSVNSILTALQSIYTNDTDLIDFLFNDYLSDAGIETEPDIISDIIFANIQSIFFKWLGHFSWEDMKNSLIPEAHFSIEDIVLALDFPTSILKQWDDGNNAPLLDNEGNFVKARLAVNGANMHFNTSAGFSFNTPNNISFTKAEILNTGITIAFTNAYLDLSQKTNIPQADAAGYPTDFIGVFVEQATIGLPPFWTKTPNQSIDITGKNLLIGTGGFSGTIGLDGNGVLQTQVGGFSIGIDTFEMVFQQNAIISSIIQGSLIIPGFNADQPILVDVFIGTGGEFSVTASASGVKIGIQNVFDFYINSLSIHRTQQGEFYLALSGSLDITYTGLSVSGGMAIKKLIIWSDGRFEFEGGVNLLPKTVTIPIGPSKINITALHLGTAEINPKPNPDLAKNISGGKYKFIGFDGAISLNPIGIDARGKGIKLFFKKTGEAFVRIESLAIDMVIPGKADPDKAALVLSGSLGISENPEGVEEYSGSIKFTLPKIDLSGSASMTLQPQFPNFLIDVGIDMTTGIPLASTGLGIYGFRGLIGHNYVASKTAVTGLSEEDPWWRYYKAPEVGVNTDKFDSTQKGFSLGAGVSLATLADSGRAFSSKVLFLLSLPEVFLLEGKAAILKKRIGLDTTDEPPFYALIAISNQGIEGAFGANYKMPADNGTILHLDALAEMAFYFGNAKGWYINIGKDQPEDRRIRAKILSLFDAYAYLMLHSKGIKTGAGVSIDFQKKYGPVSVGLGAYLALGADISFKPAQLSGFFEVGAYAFIKVFGFKLGFDVAARLSAEAPRPLIVYGMFQLKINLPKPLKNLTIKVEMSWKLNTQLNTDEVLIIDAQNTNPPAAGIHILTKEVFPITYFGENAPADETGIDAVIPIDTFIDIEFAEGVHPYTANLLGNVHSNYQFTRKIGPKKVKSQQVEHRFIVEEVSLKYWNEAGQNWLPYLVYDAIAPPTNSGLDFITPDDNINKLGYWQLSDADKINKLRLLAQDPLSYISQYEPATLENFGFNATSLLCPEVFELSKQCINLHSYQFGDLLPKGEFIFFGNAFIRIISSEENDQTLIVDMANPFDIEKSLMLSFWDRIEIYFPEPASFMSLKLSSMISELVNPAGGVSVNFSRKSYLSNSADSDYVFQSVELKTYNRIELLKEIIYENDDNPIDLLIIYPNYDQSDSTMALVEHFAHLCPSINALLDPNLQPPLEPEVYDGLANLKMEVCGHTPFTNSMIQNTSSLVFLHEVCWKSKTSYQTEMFMPDVSDIETEVNQVFQLLNTTLQPLWRPGTQYLLHIKTKDELSINNTEYIKDHYWGFKTNGPVGYTEITNAQVPEIYNRLEKYIDYSKSYPNADGDLISAKPLYYSQPKINLFFNKSYVRSMFRNFAAYLGLSESSYELLCEIIDPAYDNTGNSEIINAGTWSLEENESLNINNSLTILNNIYESGEDGCMEITSSASSLSNTSKIELNETLIGPLLPSKLYTVVFKVNEGVSTSKEVHRFNFQTSRYTDFNEHINSYFIYDENGTVIKEMRFDLLLEDSVDSVQSVVTDILNNTLNLATSDLARRFPHRYDQLYYVLGIKNMPPALTTEINVLKTGNQFIGLLVRSPEPFTDPKEPEPNTAIQAFLDSDSTFKSVSSKDAANVFLIPDHFIPFTSTLFNSPLIVHINFDFKLFDGTGYSSNGASNINIDLT